MSIDASGLNIKLKSTVLPMVVEKDHRLIKLANSLPIEEMAEAVIEDLKNTTQGGCWWTGRPIVVRIHLMIYLLQKIFDYTDRQVIVLVQENAVYQVFCGRNLVDKWHIPVHQKIEEFRNRLSPETQSHLANMSCKAAVDLGLADPSVLDVDSTPQEANMSYPSDARLMVQLAKKVSKIASWVEKKTRNFAESSNPIDLSALLSKAKGYFFQAKNIAKEKRQKAFKSLFDEAKRIVYSGLEITEELSKQQRAKLPWNIKRSVTHLEELGKRYILDVAHFIRTNQMKVGKIMSFHLSEVACLTKGKAGKLREFGREFQIGRIGGNFVISNISGRVRADDKNALTSILETHESYFGKVLESLATDKGYQSKANEEAVAKRTQDYHLGYQYEDQTEEDYLHLYNRRAGIEPIIGHIKRGGQLGKSRMKSDTATLAAGYGAMLGFNLRQIIRKS